MSDVLVARAPGKLFLLGEYAVLDGGPAVVAAVDRYAEVHLRREPDGARVRITAPGCGAVEFAPEFPPAADGPLRFVVAAYRAVRTRHPELGCRGYSLTTTTEMVGPDSAKVGLGSSAAVTVAAVAAFLADSGADVNRDELFAIALSAHRDAQDGVGSGADVAASAHGGLLLFQPRRGSLPAVSPLAFPANAHLLAAWSGESASTADLVKQYLGARNGSAGARAAFVVASRSHVETFVDAVQRGMLSGVAVDDAAAALERMGDKLGLPVLTPRLRELIAIARAHGAAAKTSGAGGGDCSVALTCDATAAERIRCAWRAAQLVPLPIRVDRTGVTVARG